MKGKNLQMDKNLISILDKENTKQTFNSSFGFLNTHFGLRPNRFHVLVGGTGIGKSSLTKKVVYDSARNGKKVGWWLSEENYNSSLLNCKDSWNEDFNKMNIKVWCESDESNIQNMKRGLTQAIIENDLLVFDNISTSSLYEDLRPDKKSQFIRKLKDFAYEKQCTVLVICHTAKSMNSKYRLIDDTDVRGVHTLCNIAEYLYLVQRIIIEGSIKTILQVFKHRYHSVSNRIWKLAFDHDKRIYYSDTAIDTKLAYELLGHSDNIKKGKQ